MQQHYQNMDKLKQIKTKTWLRGLLCKKTDRAYSPAPRAHTEPITHDFSSIVSTLTIFPKCYKISCSPINFLHTSIESKQPIILVKIKCQARTMWNDMYGNSNLRKLAETKQQIPDSLLLRSLDNRTCVQTACIQHRSDYHGCGGRTREGRGGQTRPVRCCNMN